jgi:hypothetical protein
MNNTNSCTAASVCDNCVFWRLATAIYLACVHAPGEGVLEKRLCGCLAGAGECASACMRQAHARWRARRCCCCCCSRIAAGPLVGMGPACPARKVHDGCSKASWGRAASATAQGLGK